MSTFSERYGYTKPSDIIIREKITKEIQNAICSCYDRLSDELRNSYFKMELYLWTQFLCEREAEYYGSTLYGDRTYRIVTTDYIENEDNLWYKKLDLIEYSLQFLKRTYRSNSIMLAKSLNSEFIRLNFGYRIIDNKIIEITSQDEVNAIETALNNSFDGVRTHLNNALQLLTKRPVGDYRNSIKESISAVEFICRKLTGESTLGKAISKLEYNGVVIPQMLKKSFQSLYDYTNHPETGIRHALMDEDGKYTPTSDEAIFMLVTCSAFINYLNKKQIK